jgi:16S rRNA (guanine(1405)-N(7))-methyltransferase
MQDLAEEILRSRKYRDLGIPAVTVLNLLENEQNRHRSQKDAVKEVRKKLHHIVAPYLGDPDYELSLKNLELAFSSGSGEQVKTICSEILAAHASTRERMQILSQFYQRLFEFTGRPDSILDLACGLNPFSFSWMELPVSVRYYVYDLNWPRLRFIHQYFEMQGLADLGESRDILLDPPREEAHVAFFFKEAHRFEQRQPGCNLKFWQALNVHYLLVSLPTSSLSGKHNLLDQHRRLVYNTLRNQTWAVTEFMFDNEIVFGIDKTV